MLEAVADEVALPPAMRIEALDTLQRFYNGYCFDSRQTNPVYNPTLVLYFLDHLQRNGRFPENLLDVNLAMDRNRIEYIASTTVGQKLISDIALDLLKSYGWI